MRGTDRETGKLFSYASPESLVPNDHPLRPIRLLMNGKPMAAYVRLRDPMHTKGRVLP